MRKLSNLTRLDNFININRAVLRKIITIDLNATNEKKTILLKMTNAKSNTYLHRTEKNSFAHLHAVNYGFNKYYRLGYIEGGRAIIESINKYGEWVNMQIMPIIKINSRNIEAIRYCNNWIFFHENHCWIATISNKTWDDVKRRLGINNYQYEYLTVKADSFKFYDLTEIETNMKNQINADTNKTIYQEAMTETNSLLKYKISPRCIGMKAHTTFIKCIYKNGDNEEQIGTLKSKKEAYDKLKGLFTSKNYKSWLASLNRGSRIKFNSEVVGKKIDTGNSVCKMLGDTLVITVVYDCYLLNNNCNIPQNSENLEESGVIIKKVTVPATTDNTQEITTSSSNIPSEEKETLLGKQELKLILTVFKNGKEVYSREKVSIEQAKSDLLSVYHQQQYTIDDELTIEDLKDKGELLFYDNPDIMATLKLV
jgi:hypothetical protein